MHFSSSNILFTHSVMWMRCMLLHCLRFHQVDLIAGLIILCAFLNQCLSVISECQTTAVNLIVILKLQRLLQRDVGVGA